MRDRKEEGVKKEEEEGKEEKGNYGSPRTSAIWRWQRLWRPATSISLRAMSQKTRISATLTAPSGVRTDRPEWHRIAGSLAVSFLSFIDSLIHSFIHLPCIPLFIHCPPSPLILLLLRLPAIKWNTARPSALFRAKHVYETRDMSLGAAV